MSRLLLLFILGLAVGTVACGRGVSSSSSSNNPSPASGGANPGGAGPQNLGPPNVVSVSGGGTASGVNITVAPPASSPPINALNLGTMSSGFASNVGVTVPRGSTPTIILFGPGLSADMTVTLSGPNDIGVNNIRAIKATNGTPGIAFDAAIGSSAALGARTVFLRSTNNDITAFTGGLEITQ